MASSTTAAAPQLATLDPSPPPAVRLDITSLAEAVELSGGAGRDREDSERLLARLRRRGYADDGGLLPHFARLAADVAGAAVRFDLWRFAGRRTARHTVWTGPRGTAVARHHQDGSVSLEPLEASRWAEGVTALTGHRDLARDCGADDRESARLPRDLLCRFLDAMSSGDAGRAASYLAAVRTDLPALRLLHGLALEHGVAWSIERRMLVRDSDDRLTLEPRHPADQVLTVLDGGSSGLWADAGRERFEPVLGPVVKRRLDGLLTPAVVSPAVSTVAPCPSSPKWRPSAASSNRS